MCGWSILSLESYQEKLQKKKKKAHLEWTSFLRAKALQGCQNYKSKL